MRLGRPMSQRRGHNRRVSIETLENVENPLEAGLTILGSTLTVDDISLRIVEVEAYGGEKDGPWPDPAAHSYRGERRGTA